MADFDLALCIKIIKRNGKPVILEWSKIKTVLLDMDGTLLDLNYDNHFWKEFVPLRYSELHCISVEQAKQELIPRFQAMEGKLEWYCLDYWSTNLNMDIAGLKQEIAGLIAVHPYVVEFLEAMRTMGKRLLLVTNAHRDSLNLKMEKTCLHVFFDDIICSHDYGLAKEQAGFWQIIESKHKFDKQSSLLVDDSLAVLRSAQEYGIEYIISINKPDSQAPKRNVSEFNSIQDFRELMPDW